MDFPYRCINTVRLKAVVMQKLPLGVQKCEARGSFGRFRPPASPWAALVKNQQAQSVWQFWNSICKVKMIKLWIVWILEWGVHVINIPITSIHFSNKTSFCHKHLLQNPVSRVHDWGKYVHIYILLIISRIINAIDLNYIYCLLLFSGNV